MQVFGNEEFGKIRTLDIDGVPWFIGKDVAEALGYEKIRNALSKHVDADDALKRGVIDSLGRTQETTLINESGLYSLILSSKLPSAKKFKRLVTSEVIPSIRKHGAYVTESTLEKMLDSREFTADILEALAEEHAKNAELEGRVSELTQKARYCITTDDLKRMPTRKI